MDRNLHLPLSLKQADTLREGGQWAAAVESYLAAESIYPENAGIKHNIALCHLALKDALNALRYAERAIRLNGNRWQTHLIKAKCLGELGRKEQAISLLIALARQFPAQAEIRLELASHAIDELGDATLARGLVQPVKDHPRHAGNARLTELMACLYDGSKTAEELSAEIRSYANTHLAGAERRDAPMPDRTGGRRRIGLMSPQFCCSPVYFFCIGALRHLAREFDLVFLNRGQRSDWASTEFKSLAREWHETAGMNSLRLASFIACQNLDVLIDMGGWMDPAGLSAISARPAGRIYKWVGGQSASTGIAAFDGFFTDRYQSDPQHQAFYAEPLIFLERGYVTYTPPAYMPAPVAADANNVFGVIANPVKISAPFLDFLKDSVDGHSGAPEQGLKLRFIDRRYRHARLRMRIVSALASSRAYKQKRLQIEFIVPQSHRHYLEEVGKLAAVIDTFPYTGGLTTIEALALGVPCFTKAGSLFSQRHSYSHCMYAGMEAEQFEMEKNLHELLQFCHQKDQPDRLRSSLIRKSSDRLNHQALAEDIAQYLRAGIHSSS